MRVERFAMVGVVALALGAVVPVRAAEPIDCDFLTKAIGVIPSDVLVETIDNAEKVPRSLLDCAVEADAPAEVLAAIQRQLGLETDRVDTPWVEVDTSLEDWPERLGRSLATAVQSTYPGEVPLVVMFVRAEDIARPPWWYEEYRDRVAGRLLERLPDGSAAAESPEVLDADAWALSDPEQAPALRERLFRMGFRRTLLLVEQPVQGTNAVDVTFEVHDIDRDVTRTGQVRARPKGAVTKAPRKPQLAVQAEPVPVAPGGTVTLQVSRLGDDIGEGPVDVWAEGRRVAGLTATEDGWTGSFAVPEEPRDEWSVFVVHPTREGDFGWLRVGLPVDEQEGDSRALRAAYETDADAQKRERRKLVRKVGVLVSLGLGFGAEEPDTEVGTYAVARAPWTVDELTYRASASQRDMYGNSFLFRLPLEIAVQIPGVRIGAHGAVSPRVQLDPNPRVTPGGTIVNLAPLYDLDLGASLLFGARNGFVGGWFGLFVEQQWLTSRARTEDQQVRMGMERGVLGIALVFDRDLGRRGGLGVDVRVGMGRIAAGTPTPVRRAVSVGLTLRGYFRAR